MPAASTSSSPVLVSKHHSPLKEPESSLKKRLVTDLGQRWMMSPGSPLLPERRKRFQRMTEAQEEGRRHRVGGREGALGGRVGQCGEKREFALNV